MTDEPKEKISIAGTIARDWWKDMQSEPKKRKNNPAEDQDKEKTNDNSKEHKGNPGALARLRRADLFDAISEGTTIDLFRRFRDLPSLARDPNLFERTALVAAVLAHVRKDEKRRVAVAAGEKKGEDRRRLHPLRLRRLFATRQPADCLVAFRRLVAILDRSANVADLAVSLLEWPDEIRGDRRRMRWAFDYYDAGSAAPSDDDQPAEV